MPSPSLVKWLTRIVALISALLLLYDVGFNRDANLRQWLFAGYLLIITCFAGLETYQLWTQPRNLRLLYGFRLLLPVLTLLGVLYAWWINDSSWWDAIARFEFLFALNVGILLLGEMGLAISRLYQRQVSPPVLFSFSFVALIVVGALLLMLPNATTKGISLVDAVFTATSAVCVTGLAVIDTGHDFTWLGQAIILVLIQLGGLGMLTFTTIFAYFFRGNTSSFREGMFVRDFLSADDLSGAVWLSLRIVLITLLIELAGAVAIFFSVPVGEFSGMSERLWFAVFHAISAFCNAGFSTLSNGLYDEAFRFSYHLQLFLALLFIIGGLGFNTLFNLWSWVYSQLLTGYNRWILRLTNYDRAVRIARLNTLVVWYTTLALVVVGTVGFFILEYRHALAEHPTLGGKLVTAFFGATTPRTAGFNTVDMTTLAAPTVLFTMLLMWIGAAPASTGGGIKVSTFALATYNIFLTATGRRRMEIGTREVPPLSVNRAFAIISISLLVVGVVTFLLAVFEPDKSVLALAFEAFSAYSTVGLSLGITGSFTTVSKWVLVAAMFVGRVGALNLLIGMLRQVEEGQYRYPEESVLIN